MNDLSKAQAVSIWSYEGRSSRADYFVVLLITAPLGAIAASMMAKGGALGFFSGLFFIVLLWVSMCASARRLHDIGHSGWWSLLAVVPGANLLFGLYALVAPGEDRDNAYGSQSSPLPARATSTPQLLVPRTQVQQSVLIPVSAETVATTQVHAVRDVVGVDPMEEFWAQASHECESGAMKSGLWAKAYADAGADERVAKAKYIRLRATQLQEEYVEQEQAQKLIRDQEFLAEQEQQRVQEAEVAELLAKMTEAKRADALLPKGKCPACGEVIPLASEQCSKCTALFSADSSWKIKPLSRYEAIAQKAVDDAVLYETQTKEEKQSDNVRQLIILGVVLFICVLAAVNSE